MEAWLYTIHGDDLHTHNYAIQLCIEVKMASRLEVKMASLSAKYLDSTLFNIYFNLNVVISVAELYRAHRCGYLSCRIN